MHGQSLCRVSSHTFASAMYIFFWQHKKQQYVQIFQLFVNSSPECFDLSNSVHASVSWYQFQNNMRETLSRLWSLSSRLLDWIYSLLVIIVLARADYSFPFWAITPWVTDLHKAISCRLRSSEIINATVAYRRGNREEVYQSEHKSANCENVIQVGYEPQVTISMRSLLGSVSI